jgi:hypothetical protein
MPDTPKPPSPEDDEVLDTGQEEVFSRREVELGEIEHSSEAGRKDQGAAGATSSKGSSPP